jgi:hypothetical protein
VGAGYLSVSQVTTHDDALQAALTAQQGHKWLSLSVIHHVRNTEQSVPQKVNETNTNRYCVNAVLFVSKFQNWCVGADKSVKLHSGQPGFNYRQERLFIFLPPRLDLLGHTANEYRGLNSSGSGYGPMAGSCEHGYEPSGSIK